MTSKKNKKMEDKLKKNPHEVLPQIYFKRWIWLPLMDSLTAQAQKGRTPATPPLSRVSHLQVCPCTVYRGWKKEAPVQAADTVQTYAQFKPCLNSSKLKFKTDFFSFFLKYLEEFKQTSDQN